jgi:tetratricopeptide (TPR) repeat protein
MLYEDKKERAEELVVKIGITDPDSRRLQQFVYDLLRTHGTAALMEYGRKLIENNPDSIEAHRTFQNYLKLGGNAQEALTIYGKMRDSNPGSPVAQYLYARAMPFREAGRLFAELAVRFPDDPFIARAHSWSLYQSRNYTGALQVFEKLAKLDRKHLMPILEEYASALVALGRADEAAQMVAGMAGDQAPEDAFTHALLYARVAKLAGDRAPHPPDHFCKILAKEDPSLPVWLAVYIGERPSEKQLADIKDESVRSYVLFTTAIEADPAAAVMLAQKFDDRLLRRLEPSRGILIMGELLRLGRKDEANRVVQACNLGVIPGDAVRNYILTGEFAEELHEINLDWQAAGHFCRARLLESQGKSEQGLYRMAEEMDLLKGVVTHAVRNWPRPGVRAAPR